jgi:hypothetical protein
VCVFAIVAPIVAFAKARKTLHEFRVIGRVGQNRINTPYMTTVYMVISLPKRPYIHRVHIYTYMVLANPS